MVTGAGPGGTPHGGTPARSAPFVPLTRVRSFLDDVPHRPVSVVTAPAGSGKTAAVAAWCEDRPDLDVRWLRARRTAPGDLARTVDPGQVLVVDDAHLLLPGVVDDLDRMLAGSPDPLGLLLLTRREPTWLPAPLAITGRVGFLRFPELRLGPDEAADLVRLSCPDATGDQVADLVARSGGWPAALVLGARSLPGAGTDGGAPPAVLDRLLAEVVDELAPSLRRVLTCVASEGAVTTDQAVVMSGVPFAGDLLAGAAAEGLLVARETPTPGRPAKWRLHPLLVEMLHRRAAVEGAVRQQVSDAHERAARHHARHGDAAAAVRHAASSGDLRLQVEVLREFTPELVIRGDGSLVEATLDHLPDALRAASPELVALDALVLRLRRRYDAAKRASDQALAGVRGSAHADRDLDADLAMLDVWQARCGWRPRQRALDRAVAVLGCHAIPDEHPGAPASHGHDTSGISPLRSAGLLLDVADLQMWSDDLDAAVTHVQIVDAYAQEAEIPRLSAGVLGLRAVAEMIRGAYQTSAATAAECLERQEREGLSPGPTSARCHLVRGWARFHALDHEGAAADLADSAEGHDPFDPVAVVYRRLLEVNLLLARGDLDGARQALDREGALPGPLPAHAKRHLGFARFRVAGYAGDLAGMVVEARTFRRLGYDADADLAEALVRGLSGSEPAAVRDLDALLARTDLDDRPGELPRVTAAAASVARAALLQRIGTAETLARAADLVPDVLSRVGPQRLWWLLATGSMVAPGFVDLVAAEAERPDAHPAAGDALRVLRQQPRPYPARATSAVTGADPAATGLTARELDVLRSLGAGGSNHDIAHELFVTENTVKTHLAAIYRKLGVADRAEAAREARRLGLLTAPRPGPFRVTRTPGDRA